MASLEKIEEYLESVEEYFYSSMFAVTDGLPDVHEVVNRLWVDISRYGPGMPAFPDVHIPSLGDFQVPPPPPPLPNPTPASFLTFSGNWVAKHPWQASAVAVGTGVVGAGLLVGYKQLYQRHRKVFTHRSAPPTPGRRQVVVIIGGDTPCGLPLILELERKGYIVITSVSTPEAIEALEKSCEGYVKALVLDPEEPSTVPIFLRSLASTLSRKFPLKSSGDPYSSPSSLPYIQSVVSLLTIPSTVPDIFAPLEHISLRDDYIPYLNATQITPLQVIQQLLPLLRTGSARSRDKGKKSIIVCLPAADTRVGLPFSSIRAMSAVGTLRATEILRREINVAALTDKTESIKNIKVVVVDVGAINTGTTQVFELQGVYKAMEGWTASEKVTYGPAFASILHETSPQLSHWGMFKSVFKEGPPYRVTRKPTDMAVFVNNIVGVVTGGRSGSTFLGFNIGLGRIMNWIRGERFSVGAGANTYRIASNLPSMLLDSLLNVSHYLIDLRNRLVPVLPFRQPPVDPPSAENKTKTPDIVEHMIEEVHISGNEIETLPESDIEHNNAGESVESSWISLSKAKIEK